jgi:hypothetical protein
MTRMHAALGAVLVLLATAAQAAPAKQDAGRNGGPPPPGAILEATATASASGNRSTATATADCPPGTKAAGGGFDAPSSAAVTGLVYESVKVGKRSWRASVQLLDPGAPSTITLTTYAYCRSHLPATKTAATTVPTKGQLELGPTASAACPPGRLAVAGGFQMPPPLISSRVTELFFDSLRSGSSGWDARVITGPAGPSTVTSEAYCAKRPSSLVEASGASAPNGVDSTSSTAVASCPAGLSPAVGGFAQPDGGATSFFFVYASRRVGDSWQVSGLHSGSDPPISLRAAAYCG